jgi:hypothetical protein
MADIQNDHLLRALRIQLAAVKQHFIHVLTLEAREDTGSAAQITRIDSVDLPNAMQLVDHLISNGRAFDLCLSSKDLLESLPMPGFSNSEIAAAEQLLETELSSAFEICLKDPGILLDTTSRTLLSLSHSSRSEYQIWLSNWVEQPETAYPQRSPLSVAQSEAIDVLFANMMVMIDQTMIHLFVQLHAGQKSLAEMTWEVSGAAMMQATALTKSLAERGLAANPKCAIKSWPHKVPLHTISLDPSAAFAADREFASHCWKIGLISERALANTEFSEIAEQVTSYFRAVIRWVEGTSLPNIPNPCRDFGRTRELYLSSEPIAKVS